MGKLFQIEEDDLAELERMLPQFQDALMRVMQNVDRVRIRRVKEILSNVRWNYGPPTNITIIPADGTGGDTLPGEEWKNPKDDDGPSNDATPPGR